MSISVIIPIYNPDINLLIKCMNSISFQLEKEDEILCIINGDNEKDNNLAKILSMYNGVKSFYLDIKGVSRARNYGIQKAKNDWIIFLDCDDLVEESFLDTVRSIIKIQRLDLALFKSSSDYSLLGRTKSSNKIINNLELTSSFKNANLPFHIDRKSLHGKAYKRSLNMEKNISFKSNQAIAEDTLFNLEYFLSCKLAYASDKIVYYYNIKNDKSTTQKANKNAINDIFILINNYNDIIENNQLDFEYTVTMNKEMLFNYIPYIFRSLIFNKQCNNSYLEKKKNIVTIVSNALFKKAIIDVKYKDCANKKQLILLTLLKLKLYSLIVLLYKNK